MSDRAAEPRFAFGRNWRRFLESLDDTKVAAAEQSLTAVLGSLDGLSFLDVGSGSGLFSLAARNLGAAVRSFDFDAESVACTSELRRRYHQDDERWVVEQGSVLDTDYMESLGTYDVVYSWGVLHHTGDMATALDLAGARVAERGRLFIAIYNDQGFDSRVWWRIKRRYVEGGRLTRAALLRLSHLYLTYGSVDAWWTMARHGKLPGRNTSRGRGMNQQTDLVDWVGGFPFEVAKPEEIFSFYADRGFTLEHLVTCGGGLGCNEFVFRRR